MGSTPPSVNNPKGVPIISDFIDDNKNNQEIKRKNKLSYRNYDDFKRAMKLFKEFLVENLPEEYPEASLAKQIETSYFQYLDPDLSMEKLFNLSMSIYHRIGLVYGNTLSYPKEELEKIKFPLLAKYIAYNYEPEDEVSSISDKLIKRMNFLTEEFPLKFNQIINIIKNQCGYVYGYDSELNLNFYIEHFKVGYLNSISYIDYIIYLMFVVEIVYPSLQKDEKKFNDKINIILNFNGEEPNTELITVLLNYLDIFSPLIINKMHIVNYDVKKLKGNLTFRENLEKIDFFGVMYFHNNKNYNEILSKSIKPELLPASLGGKAIVEQFVCDHEQLSEREIFAAFSNYLIKCIFPQNDDTSKL